jgi:hypothetical protein
MSVRRKFLGVSFVSAVALLGVGAAGLINPDTRADQSSVTVSVEVKRSTPDYRIINPLDNSGPMTIKSPTYPISVEHENVSRLEYYDCFGAAEIENCPDGVNYFAVVDYSDPNEMTGVTVEGANFAGNEGLHRIFVKAYQFDVPVDLGKAVDVLYDPNASAKFEIEEVAGKPYYGSEDPIDVVSESVDVTVSYVDTKRVEIWEGDKKLAGCDVPTGSEVNGLLNCSFQIEGEGYHDITVKAVDIDDNELPSKTIHLLYGEPELPDTGGDGDDDGSGGANPNVPNTGSFKIGSLNVSKEDVFVSVSVLVIALVAFGLYIACRRKDQKQH